MFCKKCGSMLMPSGNGLKCNNCGYEENSELKVGLEQKHSQKMLEHGNSKVDVDPIVSAKCRKCGNDKAYHAIKQTRASDEAPTKFYRCTECGYTWRNYD